MNIFLLADKVQRERWSNTPSGNFYYGLAARLLPVVGASFRIHLLPGRVPVALDWLSRSEFSESTKNHYRVLLNAWIDEHNKLCVPYGATPLARIPSKTVRNANDHFLTKEEYTTWVLPLPGVFHAFNDFLVNTGCRPSEALSLTARDLGEGKLTATFRDTKNGTTRTVPLNDTAQRAAGLSLSGVGAGAADKVMYPDQVFKFSQRQINRLWDHYKAKSQWRGLDWFTPRVLRHTCASWMVQAGVSIYLVSKFLGHKSVKVTQDRYAHLRVEDLMGCLKGLECPPQV